MALIPGSRTLIEVPVSDRTFGDTTIKQKVTFNNLFHQQIANGECSAIINVTVRSYANLIDKDGNSTYGMSLHDKGVPDRSESLTADNKSLVDAATGDILATRQFETNLEWQNIIESFTQATMLQGDFFELLRKHIPLAIEDMILTHIRTADAPPFSRFG